MQYLYTQGLSTGKHKKMVEMAKLSLFKPRFIRTRCVHVGSSHDIYHNLRTKGLLNGQCSLFLTYITHLGNRIFNSDRIIAKCIKCSFDRLSHLPNQYIRFNRLISVGRKYRYPQISLAPSLFLFLPMTF